MNNFKKIAALALVGIFFLSSCSDAADSALKIKPSHTAKEFTEALALSSGFQKVAENGKYNLYVDGDDLNIKIEDVENKCVWYSNHPDADNDEVALSDMSDVLKAQLQVDYYDSNGNFGTLNSFTDCISLNQQETYKIKNGFGVTYKIGNTERTVDDLPQKISEKNFEKIMSAASKKNKVALAKHYYKHYADDKLWALTSKGREDFEIVLKILDKSGYTEEQLAEDNSKYGLSSKGNSRVYFNINVYYTLTDNGLSVSIPCEEIKYNPENPPYELSLLPNFGAQRVSEQNKNGFLLIPDGSGALMNFNSKLSSEFYYSAPVYGYDENISLRMNSSHIQGADASLPVFGISDGKNSVAAVITDGAANASISAYRAGKNSSQYTVYPTFSVVNMDYVKLNGSDKVSTTSVFQKDLYQGCFQVEYLLCSGGKYTDMAKSVRDYYLSGKQIKKLDRTDKDIPFYLETVGGAKGAKSVLGFSYSGVVSATSYEQNTEIIKALKKSGIHNIKLRMLGWCNGGMYGSCDGNIKLISALGGNNGFKKLKEYCEQNNIGIYPDVHLISGGLGAGESKSTVSRTLDSRTLETAERVAVSDDSLWQTANAYSPVRLLGLSDKFIKSYSKLKLNTVCLADNGRVLYSDYNDTLDRQYDRAAAEKYVVRQTQNVAKNFNSIMLYGCNLYALKYAEHSVGVDMDNSWFLCEDTSVPFLQTVVHGCVHLGSKPMNITQDEKFELLRCAEYGMYPAFSFSYVDTSVLKQTEYSENFSSCYRIWTEKAADIYGRLNQALSSVQNSFIAEHAMLEKDLYRTDYENGVSIIVNYSEREKLVSGEVVPANDFIVRGVK